MGLNNVAGRGVHSAEVHLVQRAVAGDREARRELFEAYREVAYRVAYRITGNHDDALDIVQDGFIRAFERLGDYHGGASFKTWLLRIVNNRALDILRRRKVRLAVAIGPDEDGEGREGLAIEAEGDRPSEPMERQELGDRLARAIDSLPAEQRAVFSLYASGEMTYGQIAEAAGVPIGTVMSRIYHARRKLRGMLGDLAPHGSRKSNE